MKKHFLMYSFLLLAGASVARQVQEKPRSLEQLMFGGKKLEQQQTLRGHSHNDYKQNIPFLRAYYAGMESIEADVFLQNGKLMVAHELKEIIPGYTLDSLYLKRAASLFRKNGGYPFANKRKKLQIVIDIKEKHQQVIPALLRLLKPYKDVFDPAVNPNAIRIVLSGDMPLPSHFGDYPAFIFYDGRPYILYTEDQLARVAMISDNIKEYTDWNGKGTPFPEHKAKLIQVIEQAHRRKKPFRFWGTHDSPNTWIELHKMGADIINTDQPEALSNYAKKLPFTTYSLDKPLPVYKPSYKSDRSAGKVKNIILLIGDGMGLAHIKAGLSANHGSLNIANFKSMGLSRTEAANAGNTDSGAGGSAIATGHKANNATIGLDSVGMAVLKIPDILAREGKVSGLLSTGDVTDATPAVFYASQPDRSWSKKISLDLLNSNVNILAGSIPAPYRDLKKRNEYAKKLSDKGYETSYALSDFLSSEKKKQVLLLPDSVMRPVKEGRKDVLSILLKKTLSLLKDNEKGFFVMAEGAQIDYGGHANDLPYVVTEMIDFDQAVGEALRFADEDGETLVVVTADHETGGLSLLDVDEKKGYISGAFSTNDHTNIMVPVFAYGPGSDLFSGMYQNTEIFDKIINLCSLGHQKQAAK
ncbi:alkaline phosphatase [Arcticibacter tournemirensis]